MARRRFRSFVAETLFLICAASLTVTATLFYHMRQAPDVKRRHMRPARHTTMADLLVDYDSSTTDSDPSHESTKADGDVLLQQLFKFVAGDAAVEDNSVPSVEADGNFPMYWFAGDKTLNRSVINKVNTEADSSKYAHPSKPALLPAEVKDNGLLPPMKPGHADANLSAAETQKGRASNKEQGIIYKYLHNQNELGVPFSLGISENMIEHFKVRLPDLLPDMKNPCWIEALPQNFSYKNSIYKCHINFHRLVAGFRQLEKIYVHRRDGGYGQNWRMRCFPAFFLIGVAKCGTTDLFEALTMHQDVSRPLLKEPEFWSTQRAKLNKLIFNMECATFKDRASFADYLDVYDYNAEVLRTFPKDSRENAIIGDFSTHTLEVMDSWNNSLESSRHISAHHIIKIWPGAKFILLLRDPVERAFSRYKMRIAHEVKLAGNPMEFHRSVVHQMEGSAACLYQEDPRFCVYKKNYEGQGNHAMVNGGLYSIYLKDWLHAIPRPNLYIVRFEDYITHRVQVIESIARFLGIGPLSTAATSNIESLEVYNQGRDIGEMLPSTRKALQDFYRPYNHQLVNMLRDERFTWGY